MPSMVRPRISSDEHYLLDICDRVLEGTALRQHRFDFLRGDPGKDGRQARLPVDGFYPLLCLIVEVLERQHSETVAFFDRRSTVSGVSRGQQRRLYDQRRREVLPKHGLQLVFLAINEFTLSGRRLRRDPRADEEVIRRKLSAYLPQSKSVKAM
jgi:hypothetical protein